MDFDRIREYCRSHVSTYCYGAGKYGRTIRTFLAEKGIELNGFIVSPEVHGTVRILNLPVYSFDQYNRIRGNDDGIIIGISPDHSNEVTTLLTKNNICDYMCIDDAIVNEMDCVCEYLHRYDCENNITVFCYHRVAKLPMDTWKLTVDPELFDRQMRFIKENYVVLRSDETWERATGKQAAVITFDDGYEDVYTNALPILIKHGIPATVFVSTGNIDTDNEFWWDELEKIIFLSGKETTGFSLFNRDYSIENDKEKGKVCYELHPYLKKMDYRERDRALKRLALMLGSTRTRDYCRSMSSEQLRRLSDSPLITIGGHTVTHSCLSCESDDTQEWEIRQSRKDLADITGKNLSVFSYPFGQTDDFTETTIDIVKRHGYDRIFAAYPGITSTKYRNGYIPRINIGQEVDYGRSIRMLRRCSTLYGDDLV